MIPNSGEEKKKASFVLMTGKTAVRQAISERVAPISDDLLLEIRPCSKSPYKRGCADCIIYSVALVFLAIELVQPNSQPMQDDSLKGTTHHGCQKS